MQKFVIIFEFEGIQGENGIIGVWRDRVIEEGMSFFIIDD